MKEIKLQSLSNKLQIMFLLYSTGENAVKYGFTREHEEKIKNYIMILRDPVGKEYYLEFTYIN